VAVEAKLFFEQGFGASAKDKHVPEVDEGDDAEPD
jgi:hypothetical protein